MPQSTDKAFTHTHEIREDGSVAFRCSTDAALWPWLALHPLDPIVLQTIHFYASVETGAAKGTFDTSKWSALTHLEWECGAADVGHAVRGLAVDGEKEGVLEPRLTFFDAADALAYELRGKGVVFQTRDFEDWRAKAKAALGSKDKAGDFTYALAHDAGLAEQAHVYLSPLSDGATPTALGLVTRENGFPPVQPYMSGSGDHVNATHLGDIARQFAQLLLGGKRILMTSGKVQFMRYVELDHIFEVEQTAHDAAAREISMMVRQAGNDCAAITFRYEPLS